MKKMELRFQSSELRSNEDGSMTVSGYVNKTEQLSEELRGGSKKFVEKIKKGAFKTAIENRTREIDFLAEHNNRLILASTRNGSLVLEEDEIGLRMSATISPTTWGKDYYELINSGILNNMSFGFRTLKDSWKNVKSGLLERTVEALELFEVSVVRDPAYSQSTIQARGIDLVEDIEIPKEIEKENRDLTQLENLLGKFDALEEKLKTVDEKLDEVRTKLAAADEEKRAKEDEKEDEKEDKKPEKEDKKSDEKSGNSENSDKEDEKKDSDEDKKEDEKDEKEDEKDKKSERSEDLDAEYNELRALLKELNTEVTQ